jgi:FkbM family methyltransferase
MKTWFRPGTFRRSFVGPYAGIRFEISPQIMKDRMCVFYTGYEREIAAVLKNSLISPGATVYVVGAHVGIHALFVAKLLKGTGVVYAFEPWPENFDVLSHNIAANPHLSRVIAVPKAVSDEEGIIGMIPGSTDGTHHVTHEPGATKLTAPVTTIDRFCKDNQHAPSLLLVDIEGEEIRLLKGAQETIARHHPRIVMECHGPQLRNEAIRILGDWKYKLELLPRHVVAH